MAGKSGNEPVPVITADASPEKVKPADEGGLEVPNQDVAILNGENSDRAHAGRNRAAGARAASHARRRRPNRPPRPRHPAADAAADRRQQRDSDRAGASPLMPFRLFRRRPN